MFTEKYLKSIRIPWILTYTTVILISHKIKRHKKSPRPVHASLFPFDSIKKIPYPFHTTHSVMWCRGPSITPNFMECMSLLAIHSILFYALEKKTKIFMFTLKRWDHILWVRHLKGITKQEKTKTKEELNKILFSPHNSILNSSIFIMRNVIKNVFSVGWKFIIIIILFSLVLWYLSFSCFQNWLIDGYECMVVELIWLSVTSFWQGSVIAPCNKKDYIIISNFMNEKVSENRQIWRVKMKKKKNCY